MKIEENLISEYSGTSFNVTKENDITHLRFSNGDWIHNVELISKVFLGECEG